MADSAVAAAWGEEPPADGNPLIYSTNVISLDTRRNRETVMSRSHYPHKMDHSKYLHIVPSESSAGALKLILPKDIQIAPINIAPEINFMPHDLSIYEYENCRDLQLWNYGEDKGFNIFGADLTKFDGVIVWHSSDVRSMLILSLICASYNGDIQVCDVSKQFSDAMVGNLAPFQLKDCLNHI